MTVIDFTPTVSQVSGPNRVVKVLRLHLVNRMIYLGIPWIITAVALGVSIVVALLIAATVPAADRQQALEGMSYSWAGLSALWYMAVVGVQTVASAFPFALGFSITRREFAAGTALAYLVIAAINATGWTILTVIEQAINDSGVTFHHFTALWFGSSNAATVWLSLFSLQILVLALASAVTAVYVRWRVIGMVVLWIAVALVTLAVVSVIVLTGTGETLFAWLASFSVAGLFAALLVPAVLAFALGWVALRWAPLRT